MSLPSRVGAYTYEVLKEIDAQDLRTLNASVVCKIADEKTESTNPYNVGQTTLEFLKKYACLVQAGRGMFEIKVGAFAKLMEHLENATITKHYGRKNKKPEAVTTPPPPPPVNNLSHSANSLVDHIAAVAEENNTYRTFLVELRDRINHFLNEPEQRD